MAPTFFAGSFLFLRAPSRMDVLQQQLLYIAKESEFIQVDIVNLDYHNVFLHDMAQQLRLSSGLYPDMGLGQHIDATLRATPRSWAPSPPEAYRGRRTGGCKWLEAL